MSEQDLVTMQNPAGDITKPILVVQMHGFVGQRYVSSGVVEAFAKIAKRLKDIYQEKYNVVVTTDQLGVYGPNAVQLNFDQNSNYEELLNLLDQRIPQMIKEREERAADLH